MPISMKSNIWVTYKLDQLQALPPHLAFLFPPLRHTLLLLSISYCKQYKPQP